MCYRRRSTRARGGGALGQGSGPIEFIGYETNEKRTLAQGGLVLNVTAVFDDEDGSDV